MEEETVVNVRRVRSLPVYGTESHQDFTDRSPSAPLPSTTIRDSPSKRQRRTWQAPPEILYGPDNHPFFTTLAQNASSPHRPRIDSKTEEELECTTSTAYAHMNPLVHPFLPPPTIMPDESAQSEIHRTDNPIAEPGQQISFEEPTITAPTVPQSPETNYPASDSAISTTVANVQVEQPAHVADPRCTLEYVRAVPADLPNGYTLIHGQVWRGGNRAKGWRRNQWVVDGG